MDAEFKKLLNGGIWALNASDNKDPDASDINPQLVRTNGFPSVYSADVGGVKPDRRRINQLLRELSGAAFEVRMGISPYDADVDYPVDAITQITGSLYRAKIANGPTSGSGGGSNAISPSADTNQTTWERVTGAISDPEPPQDFIFDNSQANLIDVKWRNGRDGGSRIVRYDFQFRVHDADNPNPWSPATPINAPYAQQVVGPLSSGEQIQVQARAYTLAGDMSIWAQSTPSSDPNSQDRVRGNVPSGGNTLALLASQQGSLASLTWSTPSNGGFPITEYVVQWRTEEQQFSASNQKTTTPTNSTTVSGLSYDTLYYFRVAARNSQGLGDWSNVARLTLIEGALVQPTILEPSVSTTTSSFTANARWQNDSSEPTATPESATWQWRTAPGGVWQTTNFSGLTGFRITGLTADTRYEVKNTITTSIGTTGESPVAAFRTNANVVLTPPGTPTVQVSLGQRAGTGQGSISAFATWNSVAENGRPIGGWTIRWVGGGRSFTQSVGRNDRSTDTAFDTPPGTSYTVYVRAVREDGSAGGWGSRSFTLT